MIKSVISALSVLFVTSAPAPAQDLVAQIFEHYQTKCNNIPLDLQAFDELDGNQEPRELRPLDNTIYEIQLTPDGKTGTVVYPAFWCEHAGHPFCGTGGCGFYIIVDEKIFGRRGGHRPHSVVSAKGVYVILPIHGSGCVTSEGQSGAGADSCSVVAIWDDQAQTFRSKDGEIYPRKLE